MNKTKERRLAALVLLPFLLVFFLFQILPLLVILIDSFKANLGDEWGLGNYLQIIESRYFMQSIVQSLKLSLLSSIIGLALAVPCAWSLHRLEGRLKNAVMLFSNMIANFSGIPLAFAFVILFGASGFFTTLLSASGVLNGFDLYSARGLLLVYVYIQFPIALLLIYPALDGLKDEWQEAAGLLGANRLKYWQSIGIPVIMPPLLGTMIILFANAMGTYATAFALTGNGVNLMTIRIGSLIAGDIFLDPWLASALSMYLVMLLVIICLANEWLMKAGKRYVGS